MNDMYKTSELITGNTFKTEETKERKRKHKEKDEDNNQKKKKPNLIATGEKTQMTRD